jgi:hypothetical protein
VRASCVLLVLALAGAPGIGAAQSVAVLTLAGPGGGREVARAVLPAQAQSNADRTHARLEAVQPADRALGEYGRARAEAQAQMASFTELERAESAVAIALTSAFDTLPYLDDVGPAVRLSFDLATVRLALGDRDGAGEALGLGARLDPRLPTDPQVHPPSLVQLASEVRPPASSPPAPLPISRTRALADALGVDTLVIARPLEPSRVEVFVVRAEGGQTALHALIEQGRIDDVLMRRLTALGLARRAPSAALERGEARHRPPPLGHGSSTWVWLGPVLGAVAIAGGVALYLALPDARDDVGVTAAWCRAPGACEGQP